MRSGSALSAKASSRSSRSRPYASNVCLAFCKRACERRKVRVISCAATRGHHVQSISCMAHSFYCLTSRRSIPMTCLWSSTSCICAKREGVKLENVFQASLPLRLLCFVFDDKEQGHCYLAFPVQLH